MDMHMQSVRIDEILNRNCMINGVLRLSVISGQTNIFVCSIL